MGRLKFSIHPLFFLFGLYYAFTGRILIFIIYTISAVSHELGHSIIASNNGYRLDKITLMPFGALISGQTDGMSAKDEFKIAIAGPLTSLAIGLFFMSIWWIYPEIYALTDVVVEANIALAVINFLPVYPLDGGRILNAVLSTRIKKSTASKICKGIGVAVSLILFALFIASIFYTLNVSLLFFSVFILFGALGRDRENQYVKLYTSLSYDKLKRGAVYKKIGVDKGMKVKTLIGLLDSDKINEVVVYSDGEVLAILSPEKLNKLLEICEYYQPIEKYL